MLRAEADRQTTAGAANFRLMSAPHCVHAPAAQPSESEVAAAMDAAESRSLSTGHRLTPPRRRVLELLIGAGRPMKAYDLMAQFKEGATPAPPTVYRALDALVAMGLAHRIASMNAYIACHGVGEGHAASFLICDCCGAVEEISGPTAEAMQMLQGRSDFLIQTVEAHGRCGRCRALI